jgi:hypothetical protein
MTVRPPRAQVTSLVLAGTGVLILLAMLLLDPVRGKPFELSLQQGLLGLFGLLCAAEGILALRGRPGPALWSALTDGSRAGTALAYVIAGLLAAFLLHQFRAYSADDSYITFRFARNLAQGAGVVWNPGEPPVEGYSNFLWMLFSAAALRLGIDPLVAARAAAILCYAGSLVAVRALAVAAGGSARHANLAVLMFSAVPGFAYWAMSGLETLSVVLLALLYLLALTREADARGWPWRSALIADLLLMSRPDTPVLIVLAVVPLLRPFDRARRAWLGRLVLLALPLAALYLGWKGLVFHRLFANTVAAKWHVMGGITLVTGFFAYAFPLIAALAAVMARGARPLERQALLVAAGFAAALLNAASPVAHYYRLFLPALAPMLATVPLAIDRWDGFSGGARRVTAALFALALLYGLHDVYGMVQYANAEARGLERAHWQVGRLLQRNFAPDRLLAASDCGVMPYASRMRTIDIWGLTDRTIAEQGFEPAYVMRARPDVIVLHSLHPGVFAGRAPYDRQLFDAIAADPTYHLAGEWEFLGYWLWVYSRAPLR